MLTVAEVTSFLGWCSVLNVALLAYSAVMLTLFNAMVKRLHQKLFGLSDESLDMIYFKFLGQYKLLILVFNLIPYCALKIMA